MNRGIRLFTILLRSSKDKYFFYYFVVCDIGRSRPLSLQLEGMRDHVKRLRDANPIRNGEQGQGKEVPRLEAQENARCGRNAQLPLTTECDPLPPQHFHMAHHFNWRHLPN